jgi:hypothetical protein
VLGVGVEYRYRIIKLQNKGPVGLVGVEAAIRLVYCIHHYAIADISPPAHWHNRFSEVGGGGGIFSSALARLAPNFSASHFCTAVAGFLAIFRVNAAIDLFNFAILLVRLSQLPGTVRYVPCCGAGSDGAATFC